MAEDKNRDQHKFPTDLGDLDVDAVLNEVAEGYINMQSHPESDLRILNYSPKAAFDNRWNTATMRCRGLIVDKEWNIVSRPFPKFFSVEQLDGMVPNEPFEAYEKVDGSLGVLYRLDGQPRIATRGSFSSEQAKRATDIYERKYADVQLDDSLTYLFEIIYPENRIVIDYGDTEDLILLAVVETETGIEQPLPEIGFPVVKRYDGIRQFDELVANQDATREGFVVRFESGQRVKIKFEEYKRLHKLMTAIGPKQIWEALRAGDLFKIVDRVPDEFYEWVRDVENGLLSAFHRIESEAKSEMTYDGSRRELAEKFSRCRHPALMFAMLDGKDYTDMIWRMVKPREQSTFRCGKAAEES